MPLPYWIEYEPINLCVGGTAISSGAASNYPATNVFDNTTSTRWQAPSTDLNNYIGYTWSTNTTFSFMYYCGVMGATTTSYNNPSDIRFEVTYDGTNWVALIEGVDCVHTNTYFGSSISSTVTSGQVYIQFPKGITCRGFRIFATGLQKNKSGNDQPWSVSELKTYAVTQRYTVDISQDYLIGATVTTNDTVDTHLPAHAFDRDYSTYWQTVSTGTAVAGKTLEFTTSSICRPNFILCDMDNTTLQAYDTASATWKTVYAIPAATHFEAFYVNTANAKDSWVFMILVKIPDTDSGGGSIKSNKWRFVLPSVATDSHYSSFEVVFLPNSAVRQFAELGEFHYDYSFVMEDN